VRGNAERLELPRGGTDLPFPFQARDSLPLGPAVHHAMDRTRISARSVRGIGGRANLPSNAKHLRRTKHVNLRLALFVWVREFALLMVATFLVH
jgi:hypothetical protein